jgi:limonene-1,2-epoxide hydrolase
MAGLASQPSCILDNVTATAPIPTDSASAISREFLELLAAEDLDGALALLDEQVVYSNVSLPTVRGRSGVERLFRPLLGRSGFRVHFHAIGADVYDPGVVLTERTDALIFGPVHLQFWVYGRFEVRNGRIVLWRDSFDWGDMIVGSIRAVVGVALPRARRTWPTDSSS